MNMNSCTATQEGSGADTTDTGALVPNNRETAYQ
jgi:hypothetical protein